MCSTLHNLGCFSTNSKVSPMDSNPWLSLGSDKQVPSRSDTVADISTFHTIFTTCILEYV